jgi:hypothetical protein
MFVASREFLTAAEAQGRALGFAAERVLVPHPIQDRTDEEMRSYADSAYVEIVRTVTSQR